MDALLLGGGLAFSLSPASLSVEITPSGLCFNSTLATCVNKPTKDQCKP